MKTKEYEGLKLVKGLAMAALLIYSYTCYYPMMFHYISPDVNFYSLGGAVGRYSLGILMILGGFFAAAELEKTQSAIGYITNKFITYYPIYLIGLFMTVIATKFYLVERSLSLKSILLNIVLCQKFFETDSLRNVDFTYGFLTFFLFFYIFIFLVLLTKQRKNLHYISIGWAIAGFAFSVCADNTGSTALKVISLILCDKHAILFSIGISIYNVAQRRHIVSSALWIIISTFCLKLASDNWAYVAIQYLGIILIMFVVAEERETEKVSQKKYMRPLINLSDIAFPLLLIQGYFGMAIMKFLCIRLTSFHGLLLMLVPISIVIFIAEVICRYVQTPIKRSLEKGNSADKKVKRKK